MKDKRILIFGASGQIGMALQRALADDPPDPVGLPGDLTSALPPQIEFGIRGADLIAMTRADADLLNPAEIRAAIRGALPHVIINAAAYTAVDRAESEQGLAEEINTHAVATMAEEATMRGALFVHYSTDYVFDGEKSAPYTEEDAPHPLSAYGRSKLGGEMAAARAPRHLIFRTSWIYSADRPCFPRAILKAAKQHPALRVVADQTGAPTPATLVAEVTAKVLAQIDLNPAYGLYHLATAGAISRNGFARFIIARAAKAGLKLALGPAAVEEVLTAAYPAAALRPLNSQLDCTKLCRTFGMPLPQWRAAAAPVLRELFRDPAIRTPDMHAAI